MVLQLDIIDVNNVQFQFGILDDRGNITVMRSPALSLVRTHLVEMRFNCYYLHLLTCQKCLRPLKFSS